jgi:hypothetical protein
MEHFAFTITTPLHRAEQRHRMDGWNTVGRSVGTRRFSDRNEITLDRKFVGLYPVCLLGGGQWRTWSNVVP